MSPSAFLAQLRDLDIRLSVHDGRLRCNAPKGVLSEAIIERIEQCKPELVTLLATEKAIKFNLGDSALPPLSPLPVSRRSNMPLSVSQRRYWFLSQLAPDSPAYNLSLAYQVDGPLDIATLQRSLDAIARRHEVFRMRFPVESGEPVQIADAPSPVMHQADLRKLDGLTRQAALEKEIQRVLWQAFDLEQGPMIRIGLVHTAEYEHILLLSIHHIIFDGASFNLFCHELEQLYAVQGDVNQATLTPLPVQYADYASWEELRFATGLLDTQLAYWKQYFDPLPCTLNLPFDQARPKMQTYAGAWQHFSVSSQTWNRIKAFSKARGATPFMALLSVYVILLHRLTDQDNLVVGVPVSNRMHPDIEQLIGNFTNTLALRLDLSGEPTFITVLARVRDTALDAYAHQDLPFETLVKQLQIASNASRTPLFQVMFDLQSASLDAMQLPGMRCRPLDIEKPVTLFDLSLAMAEEDVGLRASFDYDTALFEAGTIKRWVGHFQVLLDACLATPAKSISFLPLMTSAEIDSLTRQHPPPTIDSPIRNAYAIVLDNHYQPVPVGITGELFLVEPGLTPDQLSADDFEPKPESSVHQSGEWARLGADKRFKLLGRVDEQIELRGHHIRPGEIEMLLTRQPGIQAAMVVARDTGQQGTILVAYVKPDHAGTCNIEALRKALVGSLPEYKVPSAYVFMDAFPLTQCGKLDHQALPAPQVSETSAGIQRVGPSDTLELHVLKLWEDILGVAGIGVNDNFFDLGGHSLLAVTLFEKISAIFGKRLPLDSLWFGDGTVAHLTGLIRVSVDSVDRSRLVPMRSTGPKRPLFVIHTMGGHLFHYADLVRHLHPGQPVYGLQAKGVYGVNLARRRIEDIATDCIDTMRELQADGPYRLAGFSSGGITAIEMAQQLRAKGQQVELLALLDTYAPGLQPKDFLKRLRYRYKPYLNRWHLQDRICFYVLTLLGLENRRSLETADEAHRWAHWSYKIPEFPDDIDIFITDDSLRQCGDPRLGWSDLAQGKITIHSMPGKHGTIVKPPLVQELAQRLQSCLDGSNENTNRFDEESV